MNSVTAEQMSEIDRIAQEKYGIHQNVLMENAGRAVVDIIERDTDNPDITNIAIFCGKGNNGGDGFVAARYMSERHQGKLVVYLASGDTIKAGPANDNYNMAISSGINVRPLESFFEYESTDEYTIIVDAVFGTGFKGEMSSEYVMMGGKINNMGAVVYAVDVPSGLNATTGEISRGCIRASKTITFGLAKKGFFAGEGPDVCGEIAVVDIGFPEDLLKKYK